MTSHVGEDNLRTKDREAFTFYHYLHLSSYPSKRYRGLVTQREEHILVVGRNSDILTSWETVWSSDSSPYEY